MTRLWSTLLGAGGSAGDRPALASRWVQNVLANNDRHLNRRDIFKQNRAAARAGWRQLAA
jgi:hypothetical protein